jgi:hypothetical protein
MANHGDRGIVRSWHRASEKPHKEWKDEPFVSKFPFVNRRVSAEASHLCTRLRSFRTKPGLREQHKSPTLTQHILDGAPKAE